MGTGIASTAFSSRFPIAGGAATTDNGVVAPLAQRERRRRRRGSSSHLSDTKNGWLENGPIANFVKDFAASWGFVLAGLGLATVIALNPFTVIGPGEVGVVTTLGQVSQIDPGFHVVNPISSIQSFSTKTNLLDQENFVPTKEGLTVELDTSVLYKIDPSSAKDIFVKIGTDFENRVIVPEVSSSVRGLTSESDAKALYSGNGRNAIQGKLKEELTEKLESRGIVIEDVLLKNVKLPKELSSSIEQKAKAEQESSRMEFVITKERQEAERKAVEAQGIADFQRIVAKDINPNLLKWKGIEATERLAQSPNAKVVVIGSGKDGLPLILGGDGAVGANK